VLFEFDRSKVLQRITLCKYFNTFNI
jgi:hypothetical protein